MKANTSFIAINMNVLRSLKRTRLKRITEKQHKKQWWAFDYKSMKGGGGSK